MKLQITKPKKSLGQNFLVDKNIINTFLKTANISSKDTVIEVGAGTGILTREIANQAKKVVAVEMDNELIPHLEENTETFHNIEIINCDVLKFIENYPLTSGKNFEDYSVVGAIPYQITSPLVHKLLLLKNPPKTITFIIQYEVAEKICAKIPNATYLSNFVSLYGNAKIIKKIKPSSFFPQPSVNSAIIKIEKKENVPSKNSMGEWSILLHKGFKHPRKMLGNIFTKDVLLKAGISPTSRAQEVKLEDWENLFKNGTTT
ncbi:MAG: 16S rRNA (adenine(1518)-N(6)/adenine(1519)-N(6))-dimethyltransferase RsmA [bacterium]